MNTPEKNLKEVKHYAFRKIVEGVNEEEYNTINKCLDIAFNDVDSYFKRTIKDKRICINEEPPKEEPKTILPTSPILNRSALKAKLGLGKRKISINKPSSSSMSFISTNKNNKMSKIINKLVHINDITDEKIMSIFESYKKPADYSNSPTKKESKSIKDDLKVKENQKQKFLKLQFKILQKQKNYDSLAQKIRAKIGKETRHPTDNLIMDRYNSFRIIKEIRDANDRDNKIDDSNIDKWYLNLRIVPNIPGIRKSITNMGTINHPNWVVVYQKFPHIPETVRSNSIGVDANCEKSFCKNSYLKGRKTLCKIKKSFSQLEGLSLKGKSLMEEEFNCFKSMKGKKRINIFKQNEDDVSDIVIADDSSNFGNKLGSNLVNSCQNLHIY